MMRFAIDKDFVIKLARILFGTGLGKTGGAVALLGASSASGLVPWLIYSAANNYLGWSIPPSDSPLWFGLLLVVIGLATAILGAYWQRTAALTVEPITTPHDVALYAKFRELMPDHAIAFIQDYDFGNCFDMRYIEGVLDVGHAWRGPRFEFSDARYETPFASVKANARSFSQLVAVNVNPVMGNPHWGTTKPDNFNGVYSPTLRSVNKGLNDSATALHHAIVEFERIAGPALYTR